MMVVALAVLAAMESVKHKITSRIMLYLMGAFVLIYQGYQCATTGVFYIAFSYFCYFLFGVAVFVPLRPVKSTAAFCCFLSGGIYLGTFLFYPDTVVGTMVSGNWVWLSWFMHLIMFSGSLLMYGQYGTSKWDLIPICAFLVFFAVYTEVAVHVFHDANVNPVSPGMVEATLICTIWPSFTVRWWWVIIWYILVAAAVWGLWELTCFINRRLRKDLTEEKFSWFAW